MNTRLHCTHTLSLLFAFLVTAFCGCASHSPSTASSEISGNGYRIVRAPHPGDAMKAWVYQLDNGLTVYLTENHEEPRIYAETFVRAGSKNDPAETTGLAHYLEHLLFKGTQQLGTLDYAAEKPHLDRISELYEQHFAENDPVKRAEIYEQINQEAMLAAQYAVPNELDKVYKTMGAPHANAHTWVEETVYKIDVPANRLEQWALLESERFASPVFRLFHTELETVYEEKNISLDDKDRIISEAVSKLLYKKHPYGQQTTLGAVEHLKRPSIRRIENYYNTYYVPNNMALALSGDIDPQQTIELIVANFSKWKSGSLPEPKVFEEEPMNGAERIEVTYPGEEYVLLAWRTDHRNSEDASALQILDMILDNQTAGLININLNQQQQVRQAGSYPMLNNEYGAQFLWGIPKKDQSLLEVENLLRDQLGLIKRGEFPDDLIPAIVTDFRKSQKQMLESNGGRVGMMREAFISFRDWDEQLEELENLARVTKEDVVRVAATYFGDNYVAGYRRDAPHEVPKIEKPKIGKLDLDPARQSAYARKILAIPVEPIEPRFIEKGRDYQQIDLGDGRKLYYCSNPLNDLFSFRIAVDKGTDHDNRLASAVRLMTKSGAGDMTPDELALRWYSLGTDFDINAASANSDIAISGLDENFEESVKLLWTVLTRPTSDDATLAEMKSIILAQREDAKKDPEAVASALVMFNRYGNESPYLTMMPSSELQTVTREQLYGSLRELLTYQCEIEYTGTLPIDQVRRIVLENLPVEKPLRNPPAYPFKRVRETGGNEVLFVDKDTAQAQIRVESGSVNFEEQAMPAIMLYNTYFSGGLSGVVYQELREARGLVYFAGAVYRTGARVGDQNVMIAAAGTQADKASEALGAIADLVDNLPHTPERFAEAASSVENRYRTEKIGFRNVLGAVRSWERLGLASDPRPRRFEAVRGAEMGEMLEFWHQYIKAKPKLISIVGPKARIDLAEIEKIGLVREITVDELYVP